MVLYSEICYPVTRAYDLVSELNHIYNEHAIKRCSKRLQLGRTSN